MDLLEERLHFVDGRHFPNAVNPLLRSSDLKGLADPFSWFLRRRLGLSTDLSHSEALTRGSWFHTAFRCWNGRWDDNKVLSDLEALLDLRLGEISDSLDRRNIDGDRRLAFLEREEQDMRVAYTWFKASRSVRVPQLHGKGNEALPWTEWLLQPQFTWLAVESTVRFSTWVAQPDLLLWHKPQNSVWVVDFKTCSGSPLKRLDGCRNEFQAFHYLSVLREVLATFAGRAAWGLPADVRLGGFIHIAVSKPSIEFCGEDRDYTLDTSPFKSGPRKGQPRNEREFHGEPKLSNYLGRVTEWFTSTGRYAHLAGDRASDPPVNAHIVSAAVLDDPWSRSVNSARRDETLARLHLRSHSPHQYPAVDDVEAPWSSDPIFPLRNIEPSKWLQWCRGAGVSVKDRDDVSADLSAPVSITPFKDPLLP